ncbi:ATP-binding protein [Robiginitalea aurantiaca]|uniref:ATP-binding protein n=1 Tax=Robiginitalea aurantiaca TaxID=3056915 RepID=A0ABT7WEL0_9FLAO|nr:ATP-binding protein [Robiginitalea aurantiaca]MDM9631345.1 ATP-binding protein [Robiginitalea aurantiaca]
MEKAFRQEPSDILKIVLYGPESTGKTTLARALATHYNTEWVPEYARAYLQQKWDRTGEVCKPEDLPPIAAGQMQMENTLTRQANRLLICDTDLLVTKVYSEVYYEGYCDPEIEKFALSNTYDLYLLTSTDVPWVADDLRDKPGEREEMFTLFKAALEYYNRSFIILKGSHEKRLEEAAYHIDKLLSR